MRPPKTNHGAASLAARPMKANLWEATWLASRMNDTMGHNTFIKVRLSRQRDSTNRLQYETSRVPNQRAIRHYNENTMVTGMNVGPSRPKGYVRHSSGGSDTSVSSINLHSIPIPEPQASRGNNRSKKWLLLAVALLAITAVAVGLSLGLKTVAENNSEIASSSATTSSVDGSTPATGTLKSVKTYYDADEEIRLRFVDPIPHEDHWIGVTRAKVDATNLVDDDIVDWVFGELL